MTTDIALTHQAEISLGTLQANTPEGLLSAASAVATPLAAMIRTQGLASNVSGKSYVRCEGWTTMGAMLGIIPREVSNVPDEKGVYTAVVELINMRTGAVVGQASGECGNADEVDRSGKPVWASRPAYARRSMAATRATSKAFRLSFSWIMTLAGFEALPAEEVPFDGFERTAQEMGAVSPRPAQVIDKGPIKSIGVAQPFVGALEDREVKTGKSDKGPWTRYLYRDKRGEEWGTYSDTLDKALHEALGKKIQMTWEFSRTGKYKDIIDFVVL